MNFGSPRQNNRYINQHINDLEINEANLSTSTFKACGPDGIPLEFFKALTP